jgi:hypothetical protein
MTDLQGDAASAGTAASRAMTTTSRTTSTFFAMRYSPLARGRDEAAMRMETPIVSITTYFVKFGAV